MRDGSQNPYFERRKMKKLKLFIINLITLILIICLGSISKADNDIILVKDKAIINKEDEFNVTVSTKKLSISAIDLNIYYDKDKIEFINNNENIGIKENELIYSWYDEHGGEDVITNKDLITLKFKAKEDGKTNISVKGKGYDKNGNEIQINFQDIEVRVGEEENNNYVVTDSQESTSVDKNNAYLKRLRINEEGLNPDFNKETFEYYFLTDKDISNLEIIAIPENSNATVNVTGNTNLKEGLNEIKIEVISEDKLAKNEYIINVTKTKNLEEANTNLETLAIENQILLPEFDVNTTEYSVEVSNNLENLNILAIPENRDAKVEISDYSKLEVGDNKIKIIVTASNGYTKKTYNLNVHRRNVEEQNSYEQEQKNNEAILEKLLQDKDKTSIEQTSILENTENKSNVSYYILIVLIFIILIVIIIFMIRKKRKIKKHRRNRK